MHTVRSPKYAPTPNQPPETARASLCSYIYLCLCLPITNAWARLEALKLLGGRENVFGEKTRRMEGNSEPSGGDGREKKRPSSLVIWPKPGQVHAKLVFLVSFKGAGKSRAGRSAVFLL